MNFDRKIIFNISRHEMKISTIAFTENGMEIAGRLADSQWTEEHFTRDAIVFIGAMGIAVRAIAPFVKTKTKDPAVIVVDELGHFSIPVLSGHIGGANELAIKIADVLGAVPVITTATDINNVFAIDTWAKGENLRILNPECIKLVSSKLLKGKTIHVKSSYPIGGKLPENIQINDLKDLSDYDVIITHDNEDIEKINNKNILLLVPAIITAGIGCRRGIGFEIIEKSVLNALNKENCHILSLKAIASIDKKANEKGILEFNTYSAEELNSLEGDFTKSDFVKSVVSVDNVCERSAIAESKGELIRRKDAGNGVTVALAINEPVISWE